jgi:hypothetical protein
MPCGIHLLSRKTRMNCSYRSRQTLMVIDQEGIMV